MSGSVDQISVQRPTILNSDENLNNPSIENPQKTLKPSLGFISGDHQTSPSECNQVKDCEENAEKQSPKPSLGFELTSESENPSEGHEFSVGDLVWAKVKYHPWWPGQIFDSSDASETALKASESALKPHKEDRLLVAHFGDQTFSWCKVSSLKPFKENFKEMSTQCNSKVLYTAMHHALDELARRVQLGLSCSCHASRKFKEETIVNWGIKEGKPVNQHSDISLAVTEFDPKSLVAYTRELAVCPRAEDELEVAMTCARLSAGRILAPLTDSSSLTPAKAYRALSSKKSKNKSKGKGSTDVKYTRRNNKGDLDDNDNGDDQEVSSNGQRFKTPTEKLPGKKLLFPTSVPKNSIASVSATDRVALLSEVGKVSKVGASITRIALQLVGSPTASTPRDQKCNTEIDGSKLQFSQSGKGKTKKKAKTPRQGKIHNKVSALKEEVYQMDDEEDVDLGSGSIKSGLRKHKMGTSSSEPKSQKKGKWQGKGITKVSEIVGDGEDIKKAKRRGKGVSKDLENVDDGEDRKKAKWQRKGTSKDLENVDDGEDAKKAKRQRKGTSKDLENVDDREDTKKTKQQRKGMGKDLENVDDGEDTKKAKRQRKGIDKDLENVDEGEDTKKAKRQRKGTGKDLENVDDGEDTKKAKRQRKGTGKDLENVDDGEDTKKSARRQRKGISKDSENRNYGEDTKKTKRQRKGISKDSENVVDGEDTKKTKRQRKEVSKGSENVDDGEDTKRQRKGISKDSENINDRKDNHVGDREDTDEEYGSVKELLLELFLLARDPTNCNGLKGRISRLNDSFLKFRTAAFQGSSFKLSGCSTTKELKQRNKKSDVGSTETPEEKKQNTRSPKRKFKDQIEDTGKQIDARKLNGISLGNEKQTNNQVEDSGKQIDARKSNGISLENEEQTDDVEEIPEANILMDVDAPTKANSDRNGNVSESTDLEGSQKEDTLEPLGDSKIDESKPEETTKATSDVTVNEAYNSVSVSTPIQSPIALFMTFPSGFSVPEENDLSEKFARYGKVTEVVRFVESGCARLVFQKHSDAELAFRSATGDKLFSPALVSFRLRYLSPKSS